MALSQNRFVALYLNYLYFDIPVCYLTVAAFTFWIKNQSVLWIFKYINARPFAGLLSANFSYVKFNQQRFMLDVKK